MKNDNQLYVNIILKDGSTLHKAVLCKNKNPQSGDLVFLYETRKEIEEVLNDKKNNNICFSTGNVQGHISASTEIESYSIIEDKE